jgi:hypothetical protein
LIRSKLDGKAWKFIGQNTHFEIDRQWVISANNEYEMEGSYCQPVCFNPDSSLELRYEALKCKNTDT